MPEKKPSPANVPARAQPDPRVMCTVLEIASYYCGNLDCNAMHEMWACSQCDKQCDLHNVAMIIKDRLEGVEI